MSILVFISFQERTTKDWAEAFDGSGIPCGPINNIKQVFEDPQVKEFKIIVKTGQ